MNNGNLWCSEEEARVAASRSDTDHLAPFFSVITIVKDDKSGLIDTTVSVEIQSFADYEHIVVDGVSDDGTSEWLSAHESRAPAHRYISEQDTGIYDAMNKGTRLARGKFIIYLNAGDTFVDPYVLRDVWASWSKAGWRWSFGNINRCEGGVVVGNTNIKRLDLARFRRARTWIPHQATFFLRRDVVSFGGYNSDYGVAADQGLMMRIASSHVPFVLDRVISNFQNGGAHSRISMFERDRLWHLIRADLMQMGTGRRVVDRMSTWLGTSIRMLKRLTGRPIRRWYRRFLRRIA